MRSRPFTKIEKTMAFSRDRPVKRFGLLLSRKATLACVIIAGLAIGGAAFLAVAQSPSEPRAGEGIAKDGATLYAENCARCHVERFAKERSDAQWKTIMLHMQIRAQIPGEDARKILEYLQETN